MTSTNTIAELTRLISKRTQMPTEQVEEFIKALFSQIEKGLMSDSHVKIGGIGVFRIIKSGNSYKILFLADSKREKTELRSETLKEEKTFKNLDEDNQSFPSIVKYSEQASEENIEVQVFENTQFENVEEERSADEDLEIENNDSFSKIELEGYMSIHLDDNNKIDSEDKDNEEISLVDYQNEEDNEDNDVSEYDDYTKGVHEYVTTSPEKSYKGIKIAAFITFFVLLAGVLLYFSIPEKRPMPAHIPFTPMYSVMPNNDSIQFSHTIIAESTIDLLTLSEKYFGNEMFWPYIYNVNNEVVSDPFEIVTGTTIRIPRLTPELLDTTNQNLVDSVKNLCSQILTLKTEDSIHK